MDFTSLASWLSPDIVESAMVTAGRFSNATRCEDVGMMLTHELADDGSYVAVRVDDMASVPAYPTARHFAVARRLMRFNNLSRAHEFFDSITHARAIAVLERALATNERPALYLRSFDLSAVVINDIPNRMKFDPGRAECATVPHKIDVEFQKHLVAKLDGPIIALSNKAASLHSSIIPELICSSDWEPVVGSLIAYAVPIILLVAEPSQGVLTELELLMHCEKHNQTIIFRTCKPKGLPGLTGVTGGWNTPMVMDRWRSVIAKFPHQFEIGDISGIGERLKDLYVDIRRDAPTLGMHTLIIPRNYGPPTPLGNAAAKEADGWLQEAMVEFSKGNWLAAEDLAYRAVVVSYLAHADEVRLTAYCMLANLALHLGHAEEGRPLLDWTKKLGEKLKLPSFVEFAEKKLLRLAQRDQ